MLLKKGTRGQLTIFIIIAILIIGIIALFFVFKGTLRKSEMINPEIAPIHNFVQGCLDETLESAVYDIAKRGGYNDPENIPSIGVKYYILNGENLMPSKEKIQNEISDYVNRKFFLCSLNFADFPDYEIEQGNFEAKTEILDNEVFLDVNYPLTIKKGEGVSRLKNFQTEIPSRFGIVYNVVSDFIIQDLNSEGGGVCVTCLTKATKEKNLYVEMNSTNEGVIFDFIDENSKLNNQSLEWIFANKY